MGKPEDWSPKSIVVVCVVIPAMFFLSWFISHAEHIEKNVLACIFFIGVIIFGGNLVGYIRNKTIYGLHLVLRSDANPIMRFIVFIISMLLFLCCLIGGGVTLLAE